MKTEYDHVDVNGYVKNGYDYQRQCWITDYTIQRCGHLEGMQCRCFGRLFAGQDIRAIKN
jgi:hypothetical protein